MWPNNADLDALAEELLEDLDHRARRRIFAESRGPRTVAQAYQLQRALRRVRERRGDKVVGFKIGYTSRTVRRHTAGVMGLSESVHGYLYNDESFSNNSDVDHRRLGIEGELGVRLIDTRSNDIAEWQVAYEPIIELHAIGMDGPAGDTQGRRGLELIGTNCIHAGVVHCAETKTGRLETIPLDAPMTVYLGGEQLEQVTLTELEVNGVYGPVGTVSWLLQTLNAAGTGDYGLVRDGTTIICSTPGGLHPVPPATQVQVEFDGLTTACVSTS